MLRISKKSHLCGTFIINEIYPSKYLNTLQSLDYEIGYNINIYNNFIFLGSSTEKPAEYQLQKYARAKT